MRKSPALSRGGKRALADKLVKASSKAKGMNLFFKKILKKYTKA
jgi:hypothetical protein